MDDLTPALALRRIIMGFQDARWVYVAAELGIADALRDGPLHGDALAHRLEADPIALHRILRGLVQLGVLDSTDDRFALTPLGHLLRSDLSSSLRPMAQFWGHEIVQRPMSELLHAVKTGQPSFDRTFGQDFFSYLASHPDAAAVFDAGMAGSTDRVVTAALSSYDFAGFSSIIDVGGGRGAFLVAILKAYPALTGVIFDRARVRESAERDLEAAGLADRCRFVAGDFFESVPEGGDGYLLSRILHDWSDAECVTILQACRRAMPEHGTLLVVELLMPDLGEPAIDAVRGDVVMLTLLPGRERTEAEFRTLFAQADLRWVRAVPLSGGQYVIEAAPA